MTAPEYLVVCSFLLSCFGVLTESMPPIVWFILKTLVFVVFFILVRGSLPRPRYDQLMEFGWKWMLPLALVNLLVTGAVVLASGK